MGNAATLHLEELIRQDFDEYLGGTRDFTDSRADLNTHKHFSWQWPKEMGDVFFSHIRLKHGLSLSMGSAFLHEPVQMSFDNWHFPLVFSYCISGNMKYIFESDGGTSCWHAQPGQSSVACFRQFSGRSDCPAATSTKWLSVYIEPRLLGTLVDLKNICLPGGLRDAADGSDVVEFQKSFAASPIMNMAIHQILYCPYKEPLRQLYLEGQTLTLLTHTLARLVPQDNAVCETAPICPQDMERVKHAKEIICNNLQNPPTLLELARTVGLHHSKLNTGFRKIYGTTIFDYLRQTRLVMAKALLDNGRMNVSEVAFAVGYASPSHFVKSFKNAYGTSPGAYLRSVSRKW